MSVALSVMQHSFPALLLHDSISLGFCMIVVPTSVKVSLVLVVKLVFSLCLDFYKIARSVTRSRALNKFSSFSPPPCSPCLFSLFHLTPAGSGIAAKGCRWWSAQSSPGTCATRCCQETSRMSWSVWLTSPWPTSFASSVASVSNTHSYTDTHTFSSFFFF